MKASGSEGFDMSGSAKPEAPLWDGPDMARRLLGGDEGAWEEVGQNLERFLSSMEWAPPDFSADCEDLVQEILTKATTNPEYFFGPVARGEMPGFFPLLIAASRNLFRDWLRRRKARLKGKQEVPFDEGRENPSEEEKSPYQDDRQHQEPGVLAEGGLAREGCNSDFAGEETLKAVLEVSRRLVRAIHAAKMDVRVRYRSVLLLALRCDSLAEMTPDYPDENALALAEASAPFRGLGGAPLDRNGPPVDEVWEKASSAILDGEAAGKACAAAAGVAQHTWLQWVSRGKKILLSLCPDLEDAKWFKGG